MPSGITGSDIPAGSILSGVNGASSGLLGCVISAISASCSGVTGLALGIGTMGLSPGGGGIDDSFPLPTAVFTAAVTGSATISGGNCCTISGGNRGIT